MGWTSYQSNLSFEEELKAEFGTGGYEVLDYNFTNDHHSGTFKESKVAYAAVQHPKGYVFGLVVLFGREDGEVYYKDMDESVGPSYYRMEKRVYDLLTEIPEQGEYSKNWRKKIETRLKINKEQLKLSL